MEAAAGDAAAPPAAPGDDGEDDAAAQSTAALRIQAQVRRKHASDRVAALRREKEAAEAEPQLALPSTSSVNS